MPIQKTVLVVDDSRVARDFIRSKLLDAGFKVIVASSGIEALAYIKSTPVDLISADLEMPQMNGYEFCAEVRNYESTLKTDTFTPIIIMTANDSFENREKGFAAGVANFITKSDQGVQLLIAIKSILEPHKRFKGINALVVDDEPLIKSVLVQLLRELNIGVFTANDGEEALAVFKEHSHEIDLIVTDLVMPVMDGKEFCRKIRAELHYSSLPILVVTGSNQANLALDLFHVGATEVIRKPFLKEEFIERVTTRLEKITLNKEVSAALSELRKLNELKDKFISVCSHDFRNPLSIIVGTSDILLSHSTQEPTTKKYLTAIKTSAQELFTFVDDLLQLSAVGHTTDSKSFTKLNLFELLSPCFEQQKIIADKKQITLTNFTTDHDLHILGDALSLKRIANNLISNSIKFTPRGGNIDCLVNKLGDKIVLHIRDSGIGIPKEKLNDLFPVVPSRGRAGTEGETSTGLGLSIIKQLVDAHHAKIEVESSPGEGSLFKIIFKQAQN